MKKRIIIIISIIIVSLAIVKLYQTFAISSTISSSEDNVYNINLTDDNTVVVPAKSSKTVFYQICNTNKGVVQYGVGYTSNNVVAKVYWNSSDPAQGKMDYGENVFIKLKLTNTGNTDDTIKLSTVLGYEFGGDLIPPAGVVLVTEKVNEVNYLTNVSSGESETTSFLGSDIKRGEIATLTLADNNIVPEGVDGSLPVGKNNDSSIMMWYTKNSEDNTLYDVYIGSENGKITINSGYYLFSYLTKIKSLDLTKLDTSDATNMAGMFYGCSSLTTIDVSDFNTLKVTNMGYMFNGCSKLTSLDVSDFDTSKVTTMFGMFQICSSLTTLDLSNFDTSNVTSMTSMFLGCGNLTTLDLSNFDTSNVTAMNSMFQNCGKLITLDVSNFDTSNVNYMAHMFFGCGNLTLLDLSNFDTSNVTTMQFMFTWCSSLTLLDVSHFDTSNVNNMTYMFHGCSKLTTLDLGNFDTSKVSNMTEMFAGCTNLKTIYVSKLWNATAVTVSDNMFNGTRNLIGGSGTVYDTNYVDKEYAKVDKGTEEPGYFTYKDSA